MADETAPSALSDAQIDALRSAYDEWCSLVEQISAPWRERAERAEAGNAALREALKRHMLPLGDSHGTQLCAGCLEPKPCPDEGLTEPQEEAS